MYPWASLTMQHSRRPRLTTSAFTNFMSTRTRKRMAPLISTESDTHFRLFKHLLRYFSSTTKKGFKELLHSRRSVLYTRGSIGAELDVGWLHLLVKV